MQMYRTVRNECCWGYYIIFNYCNVCVFFFSDIKFVIGPSRKAIHAHRCILAARCEVFRAMFSENSNSKSKDGEVPFVLSDMTPEIFLPMIEYLYTNSVTLSNKTVSIYLLMTVEQLPTYVPMLHTSYYFCEL